MSRRELLLVFVIDPLPALIPAHDTSVALMEAAQSRGHRLLATTVPELRVRDGRAVARCVPVTLRPARLDSGRWRADPDWFATGPHEDHVLDGVDAVFMRADPPVDASYLRATYLLDLIDQARTLVFNAPAGLRDANEKLFTLRFPELIPPTAVSADMAEIAGLVAEWGRAVLKPTDAMAGRGVLLLEASSPNLRSLLEMTTDRGRSHVIVQRYLSESAALGDRRVIVLDGEPLGVIRRLAAPGEFRCNMAAGGRVEADTVTARDREICARLAPDLARLGLVFAGLDVIGDRLTEVNVTSPTGVREIDALCGTSIAGDTIAWIERRCARSSTSPQSGGGTVRTGPR
jgi:glutathione synthase